VRQLAAAFKKLPGVRLKAAASCRTPKAPFGREKYAVKPRPTWGCVWDVQRL